jgi:hypothetical protein
MDFSGKTKIMAGRQNIFIVKNGNDLIWSDFLTYLLLFIIFFYYMVCEAIDTAASPGLLCQHTQHLPLVLGKPWL